MGESIFSHIKEYAHFVIKRLPLKIIEMPLQTTVVGAWPKPDYLALPDWFRSKLATDKKCSSTYDPRDRTKVLEDVDSEELEQMIEKAREEVIKKQLDLGLDVITDGEIERDNYIFHCARNFKGINMEEVITKTIRDGACTIKAPKINSKIELLDEGGKCWLEWERSEKCLAKLLQDVDCNGSKPLMKYTIPGPMTLVDVLFDDFYGENNKREMIEDLITCVNKEILALVEHGCKVIQVDEPVLMRKPQEAIDYGVQDLAACFKGVPSSVTTAAHLCCGYPSYLDHEGYKKADKQLYIKLAPLLDKTGINQFSIEDAEACNDLSELLPNFKTSSVILGAITVARSAIESEQLIKSRVEEALKHIDRERLILAPDCGLGFLNNQMIDSKVENMVKVAKVL